MRLHSSFWLDDKDVNNIFRNKKLDIIDLVRYKRSISKFVKILTKKNIPVSFHKQDASYTDGEQVYISGELNKDTFDSVVGLALHEASHIVLTDFNILKSLEDALDTTMINKSDISVSKRNKIIKKIRLNFDKSFIKKLFNYVEDRRIDNYIQKNAPGYKPYYLSMYDRYFNGDAISKALISNKFTTPSKESYSFRIINFLNKNSRLDALPDLDKMYHLIFDNINSMKNSYDALWVSYQIYDLIMKNIEKNQEKQKSDDSNDSDSKESESNFDSKESESNDNGDSELNDENSGDDESAPSESNDNGDNDAGGDKVIVPGTSGNDDDGDDSGDTSNNESTNNENKEHESEPQKFSDDEIKNLLQEIRRQENFLEGDVEKENVDSITSSMVKLYSDADVKKEEITIDENHKYDVYLIENIDETTIKVFDQLRKNYNFYKSKGYNSKVNTINNSVKKGIKLGKRLGKKLLIRNDETITNYSYKRNGKLDKRRLHALGFDDDKVFNKYVTEKHSDAYIHISIDMSASMNDSKKFEKSIESAVAIAQMAESTNINVQISMRTTDTLGIAASEVPFVWVVYDSKKHSMKYIKKWFKFLLPIGFTPEGICFETILEQIPVGNDSLKTYLINYSDGMPMYKNYKNDVAIKHTKKQIKKIKSMGYNVLSFFVTTDNDDDYLKNDFEEMYGKSARFINPTELNGLAKTLQKMFTKK